MARPTEQALTTPRWSLKVDRRDHFVDVYFVPSELALNPIGSHSLKRPKLMRIDKRQQSVTIYPTNTTPESNDFLKPRYSKIRCITLQDRGIGCFSENEEDISMVFDSLPSGFTANLDYGLGLKYKYLVIVNSVEELSNCSEICISNSETRVDGHIFRISWKDFESARKNLNRITDHSQNAARSVKRVETYNILAERLGLHARSVSIGRHPLRRVFTAELRGEIFSLEEQPVELAKHDDLSNAA